jgi:DNA-binding CsgD family transcriptional regulator
MLRERYGLTPIEAEIAADVAAGRCPREIAQRRQRTLETVRNQLRSVFAKTKTHSQLQLAVLILRGE